MRAYVGITGLVFGALAILHAWRYIQEGSQIANPWFIAITVVAAGFCLWAVRLLRGSRGRGDSGT